MRNGEATILDTVPDAELRGWVEGTTDDVRSVIVEAQLPSRRVVFQKQPDAGATPRAIHTDDGQDRESLLSELDRQLREVAGDGNTRILKTAGAVVVRATAQQIQVIAKLPLVKAIRPNRRLK